MLQKADSLTTIYGKRYIYPECSQAYAYMLMPKSPNSLENTIRASKAATIYAKVLKENATNPICPRNLLQEADMQLAQAYEQLKQYDNAIATIKAAMIRFTPYENQHLSLRDILYNHTLRYSKNKFIYYAMLGDNLLDKYHTHQQDVNLLKLAFDYLNATDSLYMSDVYSYDPDAVMNYYSEVGEGKHLYSNGLNAAYALHQKRVVSTDYTYVNAAFRFLEHKKTFLLHRDMLHYSNSFPQEKATHIYEIAQRINWLKWKQKKQRKPRETKTLDSLIRCLSLEYKEIKEKYPDYYQEKLNPPIPDIQAIQALLLPNQYVVEYGLGKDHLYTLFVGKSKGAVVFQQTPIDKAFYEQCDTFASTLTRPTKVPSDRAEQEKIIAYFHKKLLKPLDGFLGNDIQLVIIGDGQLYNLPFEVLRAHPQEPFLVQRIYIAYAPSWRIFSRNKQPLVRRGQMALAAGYGDLSTPGANRILRFLERQFRDSINIARGPACNKKFLLNNSQPIWLCHLSVHGSSSTSDSYKNYLDFRQDTLFSAELGQLKTPPQLMVLCSCNTAMGRIVPGEGAFTLTRAFLQAGVPHIVSALWALDDTVAGEVLESFYQGLAQGKDPTTSLTDAKRSCLKKQGYAENFEWAALVHII